jgi:hypothetical protein
VKIVYDEQPCSLLCAKLFPSINTLAFFLPLAATLATVLIGGEFMSQRRKSVVQNGAEVSSLHHAGGGDDGTAASGEPSQGSCLLNMLASVWVDLFHATFTRKQELVQENERIRMSAVRRDLDTCYSALQQRELDLQSKVTQLGRQAIMYRQGKNLPAARKKMVERARTKAQMEKIQNSMIMIDVHKSTIEGTALDLSVLETLKASGDVLRNMGATGNGLRAVEDLVLGLEESMQNAADITTVLSSGSVTGMVNSMAGLGALLDEEELMRELEDLTMEGEAGGSGAKDDASYASLLLSAGDCAVPNNLLQEGVEKRATMDPGSTSRTDDNTSGQMAAA